MALHCDGHLVLTASDDQTARVFEFGMVAAGSEEE